MGLSSVQVIGGDALARSLARYARDLDDLTDPSRLAARDLADAAASTAPRATGALASSMRPVSGRLDAAVAGIRYARPVDTGSRARNKPPTRFLARAARKATPKVTERYADELRRRLRRVNGA